jgi:hypothetical protein
MNNKWYRNDINTNKIILTSKLIDNDPRYYILEENYEIKEYGIRINNYNGNENLQFWINKDEFNELEKIEEFNEKCKEWKIGNYVENKIILSINDDINFDLFKFIKDEDFEKNYEKYLLTYNGKEVYIKTNTIEIFDIEENGYNQKYIRLQYEDTDPKFIDFINKFEENIKKIVMNNKEHYGVNINQHDYLSIIKDKEIKYIDLKVKKSFIESKTYNNSIICIKCNRIWDMEKIEKWGISLTVDKIIENN